MKAIKGGGEESSSMLVKIFLTVVLNTVMLCTLSSCLQRVESTHGHVHEFLLILFYSIKNN